MPRYKIYAEFGFAGAHLEDEIEAESLEEAEKISWEFACEHVNSWAEEIDEDEEDV